MAEKKDWTLEESEYVRQNLKVLSVNEMARHLNRTYGSVVRKIYRMNPKPRMPKDLYSQVTKWLPLDELTGVIKDMERNNTEYVVRQKDILWAVFRKK